MARDYVPAEVERRVRHAARHRCGYRLSPQRLVMARLEIEHVTRGCSFCSGGRIKKAIATGVDYESILAAVHLAAAVNAGVAIRTAIKGATRSGIPLGCSGGVRDATTS